MFVPLSACHTLNNCLPVTASVEVADTVPLARLVSFRFKELLPTENSLLTVASEECPIATELVPDANALTPRATDLESTLLNVFKVNPRSKELNRV